MKDAIDIPLGTTIKIDDQEIKICEVGLSDGEGFIIKHSTKATLIYMDSEGLHHFTICREEKIVPKEKKWWQLW